MESNRKKEDSAVMHNIESNNSASVDCDNTCAERDTSGAATEEGDEDSDQHQQNQAATSATSAAATVGSYYSAHIASVCEAINDANNKTEQSMSPFEQLMLQKRRETNRLSARRRRRSRREEIKHLEEQQRRLVSETNQLTKEKSRLQAELQYQVSLGPSGTGNSSIDSHDIQQQQQHLHRQNAASGLFGYSSPPPPSPHDNNEQLLRLLLLQQQRQNSTQHDGAGTSSIIPPSSFDPALANMNSQFAPSSSSMSHAALLEILGSNPSLGNQASLGSVTLQPQGQSLDMLVHLLPLLQGRHGPTAASLPSITSPWSLPQSNFSGDIGGLLTAVSPFASASQERETALDVPAMERLSDCNPSSATFPTR